MEGRKKMWCENWEKASVEGNGIEVNVGVCCEISTHQHRVATGISKL